MRHDVSGRRRRVTLRLPHAEDSRDAEIAARIIVFLKIGLWVKNSMPGLVRTPVCLVFRQSLSINIRTAAVIRWIGGVQSYVLCIIGPIDHGVTVRSNNNNNSVDFLDGYYHNSK